MIRITLDTRSLAKSLDDVAQRQLPFATAKALNTTGTDFQEAQRDTIKERFTLRRAAFMLRTVKIERGNFATKTNLRTIVNIDRERNLLGKFEEGGTKDPRSGYSVAVPVDARRNKADIVPRSARPKALQLRSVSSAGIRQVAKGLRRSFLIRTADGSGGIFQRLGRGHSSRIRQLFAFKSSVRIDKRLGFIVTAARVLPVKWPANFQRALEQALRTARR